MMRPKNTARPSSSPAGGHSDGGLSSSLPPVASRDGRVITMEQRRRRVADLKAIRVIEDVYGMDEPDVGWEPPNGWAGFVMMMIAASLADIGVGIGIASMIIRWVI